MQVQTDVIVAVRTGEANYVHSEHGTHLTGCRVDWDFGQGQASGIVVAARSSGDACLAQAGLRNARRTACTSRPDVSSRGFDTAPPLNWGRSINLAVATAATLAG